MKSIIFVALIILVSVAVVHGQSQLSVTGNIGSAIKDGIDALACYAGIELHSDSCRDIEPHNDEAK